MPVPKTLAYRGKATISPTSFNKAEGTYISGAYGEDGRLIPASIRPKSGWAPAAPDELPPFDIKQRLPAAIYAGHFFYAWGHFIVETLSTALETDFPADIPLVFSPFPYAFKNEWTQGFVGHVLPLLRAAGWGDREVIITADAVAVDDLIVPHRLADLSKRPMVDARQSEIYDRVRARLGSAVGAGQTFTLTRGGHHRRKHQGQDDIYGLLEAAGTNLLLPEKMSSLDQIETLSEASCAISFSGSVMHNSVFMPRGAKIIEIGDDPNSPKANDLQVYLCRIRKQELTFVPGYRNGEARSADDIAGEICAIMPRALANA